MYKYSSNHSPISFQDVYTVRVDADRSQSIEGSLATIKREWRYMYIVSYIVVGLSLFYFLNE
jgi:hypothetical protein